MTTSSASGVFEGVRDRYAGLTVTSTSSPCPDDQVPSQLLSSLAKWQEEGVRAVWFHVAPSEVSWMPTLIAQGFQFHHANTERVALLKWLPKEEPCNVPSYAHTLVGVGGMVVTEDNRVLVVEERFATAAHWKLPGGYVDPGEGLAEAAVREVRCSLILIWCKPQLEEWIRNRARYPPTSILLLQPPSYNRR